MLEIRRQAESLAEERKKAREQVASWVIVDVDWKDESKKASSSSNRNASKKRKHKKDRRAEGDEEMDSGAEGEAMMSGAEGGGGGSGGEERAPKAKRAKKPKVAKVKKHLDPDGEDAEGEEGGEEGEEGKVSRLFGFRSLVLVLVWFVKVSRVRMLTSSFGFFSHSRRVPRGVRNEGRECESTFPAVSPSTRSDTNAFADLSPSSLFLSPIVSARRPSNRATTTNDPLSLYLRFSIVCIYLCFTFFQLLFFVSLSVSSYFACS